MNKKTKIVAALVLYPFFAALVCILLHLNSLASVFVFLIVPSIACSLHLKSSIMKTIIFALPLSTFLFIPIDYIAHATGQWFLIDTLFPRLFQFVPIEDIVWLFFTVYLTVMLYEYFIESHRDTRVWHPRMRYFYAGCVCVFLAFLLIYYLNPVLLQIPFFYLWMGLVVVLLPISIELLRKPRLLGKMTLLGVYFFLFSFIYELTGLTLEWWNFPSTQFIGWVEVSGLKFPLEELIFWCGLSAANVIAYYEFFDDDEK